MTNQKNMSKSCIRSIEFLLIVHSLNAARRAREDHLRIPIREIAALAGYLQKYPEDAEVAEEVACWERAFSDEITPGRVALWLADRVGENVGRKQTALLRSLKYLRQAFPGRES
jgi:hypothetical protein